MPFDLERLIAERHGDKVELLLPSRSRARASWQRDKNLAKHALNA